jgi:hypothetical protein
MLKVKPKHPVEELDFGHEKRVLRNPKVSPND